MGYGIYDSDFNDYEVRYLINDDGKLIVVMILHVIISNFSQYSYSINLYLSPYAVKIFDQQ